MRKAGRCTYADIQLMRAAGKTHDEIARVAGVTRQRIQQACSKMGIPQVMRQAQSLLNPPVSKNVPVTLRNGKRTPEFSCFNNIIRGVRKGVYTICPEWNPEIVGWRSRSQPWSRDECEFPLELQIHFVLDDRWTKKIQSRDGSNILARCSVRTAPAVVCYRGRSSPRRCCARILASSAKLRTAKRVSWTITVHPEANPTTAEPPVTTAHAAAT